MLRGVGGSLRPTNGDLLAGVSVAFVAIPQSLAYAELAGLPAEYGLYAMALPAIVSAAFVSSQYLQTGPVALTSLLTFGALSTLESPGAEGYIARAALLAVLVGLFQLLLGAVRLGRAAYLLSEPVVTGFTAGAALLIVASQLPKLVGVPEGEDGVLVGAVKALSEPGEWNWQAIAVAAGTAAVMLSSNRIHKLFPGVLVAVIAGVLLSRLGYSGQTVAHIQGGFFTVSLSFPFSSVPSLLVPAAAISLAGFAETASVARRFAAADRLPWNADREIISQGVANLMSGVSGAFPVGGSFSRSSLNRSAGASTPWAGAITGVLILAILPLTTLFEGLPMAVLGTVVIVVVIGLVDVRSLARLGRRSWPQAVVGAGTLTATVIMSPRVERGVLIGLGLAITVHLVRELNVTVDTEVQDDTLTVRPHGVLWFATVPQVERLMREELARHRYINNVVIDLGSVGRLDYSGAAGLQRVLTERVAPTVQVSVTDVPASASGAVLAELRDFVA